MKVKIRRKELVDALLDIYANSLEDKQQTENAGIFNLTERMVRLVSTLEDEQDIQIEALKQSLSVPVSEMRS